MDWGRRSMTWGRFFFQTGCCTVHKSITGICYHLHQSTTEVTFSYTTSDSTIQSYHALGYRNFFKWDSMVRDWVTPPCYELVPCTNKVPWKQPSWSSFFSFQCSPQDWESYIKAVFDEVDSLILVVRSTVPVWVYAVCFCPGICPCMSNLGNYASERPILPV